MDYPELLKGYKNELIKLQEILLKERENRETDEHHAIELLTRVKEQYDLRFTQVKSDYEETIDDLKKQINESNEQYNQLKKEYDDEQQFNQQLLENEQKLKSQQLLLEQDLIKKQDFEKEDKLKDDLKLQATEKKDDKQSSTKDNENTKSIDNDALETKIKELEDSKRKIEELEINLNHKENEISNLKLDLRMANRETNRYQDNTKFLRESNKELKEKVANLEEELRKIEFKETNKESEVNSLKGMYEEIKKRNDQLSERLQSIEDEKQRLVDELTDLKCSIKIKDETVNKQRNTNLKLKSVVENLENQNDKLQTALDEEIFEREKCMNEINKQLKTINSLNAEMQILKSKLDLAEQQLVTLNEQLESKESDLVAENEKYKQYIDEIKSKLENEMENNAILMKDIDRLQQDHFEKDCEIKQNDVKIVELIQELHAIKEENSKNLTDAEEFKHKNHSLAKMYDDLYKRYGKNKENMKSLQKEYDQKVEIFEKERIKFEETIGQQSKAIDHLLEKANTKKSWLSVGRSHTDCKPPATLTPTTRKIREESEMESALQREKDKNRILMQKIKELERQTNKRKNENFEDNKKYLKTTVATAPSVTEDETASIQSNDVKSEQPNFKTTVKQIFSPEEEEFTFTDSIMEELAYKDD